MGIQSLPEKIVKLPHWRVIYRPSTYKQRIPDSQAAFDLVRKSLVRLRGWDYPYVSVDCAEQIREREYVASGCDWSDMIEYWRLYYSGQFIHLFSLRENAFYDEPGFIDITNTLYCIAEVIEFAARLSEKGIYQDSLQIFIQIKKIKDFRLWAKDRFWRGTYPATSNLIEKKIDVNVSDLLGQAASLTLDTTIYVLKLFGWDNPPRDILKNDLDKFLAGK
ncbi:MAG: hypothetical protein ABSG22_11280 [Sedimentisphaerales bacterium]